MTWSFLGLKLEVKNTYGVEENRLETEVWYGCEGSWKGG